jgi:hypothetical protein
MLPSMQEREAAHYKDAERIEGAMEVRKPRGLQTLAAYVLAGRRRWAGRISLVTGATPRTCACCS